MCLNVLCSSIRVRTVIGRFLCIGALKFLFTKDVNHDFGSSVSAVPVSIEYNKIKYSLHTGMGAQGNL